MSLSTAGTGQCPTPGRTYVIGNPKGPTLGNPNDPGDRLIDGEHGSAIKCSVNGSGPFTFSGSIHGFDSNTSDVVTLTITNGTINADKATGTATIAVNTTQLANTYSSAAGACAVTVINGNVKAGSIWAQVTCPSITLGSTPGFACQVGTSTNFVLENCQGS